MISSISANAVRPLISSSRTLNTSPGADKGTNTVNSSANASPKPLGTIFSTFTSRRSPNLYRVFCVVSSCAPPWPGSCLIRPEQWLIKYRKSFSQIEKRKPRYVVVLAEPLQQHELERFSERIGFHAGFVRLQLFEHLFLRFA